MTSRRRWDSGLERCSSTTASIDRRCPERYCAVRHTPLVDPDGADFGRQAEPNGLPARQAIMRTHTRCSEDIWTTSCASNSSPVVIARSAPGGDTLPRRTVPPTERYAPRHAVLPCVAGRSSCAALTDEGLGSFPTPRRGDRSEADRQLFVEAVAWQVVERCLIIDGAEPIGDRSPSVQFGC